MEKRKLGKEKTTLPDYRTSEQQRHDDSDIYTRMLMGMGEFLTWKWGFFFKTTHMIDFDADCDLQKLSVPSKKYY